jgi:hypothetical protein
VVDTISIIHDGMPIHLRDGDDNQVIWFGTLLEFERVNSFDDAECAHMRAALLQDGRYFFGGGAAPVYVVEVGGRYALFIASTEGHRTRRFDSLTLAVAIAMRKCAVAPIGVAAVITDLETSETIWQYAPPTFQVLPTRSAA